MTTRLSDVIDIEVYQDLPAVNDPTKTTIFESGVAVASPLLNSLAGAMGDSAQLPFWKDIDASVEANLSNDDPASTATPQKVVQGKQVARKLFLNQAWQAADLVNEFSMGGDALQHVRNRVDAYWVKQFQKYLMAATEGILQDNIANDSGDMAIDISIADGDNATADNLFSDTAFINASMTLGDSFENLGAILVHPVVYGQMRKNNSIDFIPDAAGQYTIPTYQGRRVILNSEVTVVAGGTSGFVYRTVLFGAGAFGYGQGNPTNPVEVERDGLAGNGAGIEALINRKTWLIHPFGYEFKSGTVAGQSPTIAEYKLAANWDRVVERENVPLAFLLTNG